MNGTSKVGLWGISQSSHDNLLTPQVCVFTYAICKHMFLVQFVPLVYTPALIPTHQPPPPHPSCSLSVTVGVAIMVVSGVLLLIAVSSVCLGVLVTRGANKLLARLLTPYQLLPYSLRLSINSLKSNQPSIAPF